MFTLWSEKLFLVSVHGNYKYLGKQVILVGGKKKGHL